MNLLLKGDSNWDFYDSMEMVMSIAKPDTGCRDTVFGSYSYFVRYVNHYDLAEDLTEHGYKIYRENGGRL